MTCSDCLPRAPRHSAAQFREKNHEQNPHAGTKRQGERALWDAALTEPTSEEWRFVTCDFCHKINEFGYVDSIEFPGELHPPPDPPNTACEGIFDPDAQRADLNARIESMELVRRLDPDPSRNKHYDAGGIVVLDVLRAKLTYEQFEGFLLGTAIKYALRLNFKGQATGDAVKLADYTKWLNAHINPGDEK